MGIFLAQGCIILFILRKIRVTLESRILILVPLLGTMTLNKIATVIVPGNFCLRCKTIIYKDSHLQWTLRLKLKVSPFISFPCRSNVKYEAPDAGECNTLFIHFISIEMVPWKAADSRKTLTICVKLV